MTIVDRTQVVERDRHAVPVRMLSRDVIMFSGAYSVSASTRSTQSAVKSDSSSHVIGGTSSESSGRSSVTEWAPVGPSRVARARPCDADDHLGRARAPWPARGRPAVLPRLPEHAPDLERHVLARGHGHQVPTGIAVAHEPVDRAHAGALVDGARAGRGARSSGWTARRPSGAGCRSRRRRPRRSRCRSSPWTTWRCRRRRRSCRHRRSSRRRR